MKAVIALGANLGDREHTMAAALTELNFLPETTLLAASGLYESAALKPDGVDPSAPTYLNQVAVVETELSPVQLLVSLRVMESAHGRVRHERWGDRTLDLDVISYEGVQQDDPQLTLPHPRAHERSFVLVPWAEIDPAAVLPEGSVAELAAELAGEIRRVSDFRLTSVAPGQVTS